MYTVRRIAMHAAAVIRNYLKDLLVPTVDMGKTVRADAPDLCPWLFLRCLLLVVRFVEIVTARQWLDLCLEICAYFFRPQKSSLHALDFLVLCAHEVGQLFISASRSAKSRTSSSFCTFRFWNAVPPRSCSFCKFWYTLRRYAKLCWSPGDCFCFPTFFFY